MEIRTVKNQWNQEIFCLLWYKNQGKNMKNKCAYSEEFDMLISLQCEASVNILHGWPVATQ